MSSFTTGTYFSLFFHEIVPGIAFGCPPQNMGYLGLYWQNGRKLRVFLGEPEENVLENNKTGSLPADLPVVKRERMKKRLLFVERLENAFFCLENFAFRTSPGIRNRIPWRVRGNAIFGIAPERIIDIMAFKTHIPDHFCQFSHGFFNSI
jgi:hypothetical protein